MRAVKRWAALGLGLALCVVGCDSESRPSHTQPSEEQTRSLFGAGTTHIRVEIDYAPGAAPYVGRDGLFGDPWALTKRNLEALFTRAPKTLELDETLAQMEALSAAPGGPDYSVTEILELARQHRQSRDSASSKSFYVLFLDGYFESNGTRASQVLGVSIGATGVIAMFKPVIASSGLLARRVEQTTLIHELGHAVGLVDNGLAPIDPGHVDREHGAHCTNTACIMYWQNKVGSNLAAYVTQQVTRDDKVLFDKSCLDDAHAAAGVP